MAGDTAISHPSVLLINPPLSKPSEPPAGLAKLSGTLSDHGVAHILVDANMEGQLYLLTHGLLSLDDKWTIRAARHVSDNLSCLRSRKGYENLSRYSRAVSDLNRIIEKSTSRRFRLSLTDYEDHDLSPVKSSDLLYAADHPEENPFYPYFMQRLTDLLPKAGTQPLFGFSLNYLSQALCTFAFLGLVRHEIPSAKIILGGGLITSWMSSPSWTNPFQGLVDHMISGPGEGPLLTLVGIGSSGKIHTSYSFDQLPLRDYLAPVPIIPYSASIGCYWRGCTFCPEKSEETRYIPDPSKKVVSDLKHISEQYKPGLIHLVDNALSPSLLKTMVQNPLKTPWYGFSRITKDLCNPDFCKALRVSGCVMLKIGLESGDQEVLDQLHKGITLNDASNCLSALTHAGIMTYVYLLFGTPAEDHIAAMRTLDFVSARADYIDYLNLAIFNMPVNSPETELVSTTGFYEGDLALYTDFTHPKGRNRRQVRLFLDKEVKRHPAIRPILLRQPPLFTSNHAPFFRMMDRKSIAQ
jgi:hypothetical protein